MVNIISESFYMKLLYEAFTKQSFTPLRKLALFAFYSIKENYENSIMELSFISYYIAREIIY